MYKHHLNALGFDVRLAETSSVVDYGERDSPVDHLLELCKTYTMADMDEDELVKYRSLHGEPAGVWGLFYERAEDEFKFFWAFSYKQFENEKYLSMFVRGHEEMHVLDNVVLVNGGVSPEYKLEELKRLRLKMPGLVDNWDGLDGEVKADCGGLYAALRIGDVEDVLKEFELNGLGERVNVARRVLG